MSVFSVEDENGNWQRASDHAILSILYNHSDMLMSLGASIKSVSRRLLTAFTAFCADLLDKGASKKADSISIREAGGAVAAGLAAIVEWFDHARKVVHELLGFSSALLPPLLLAFGVLWCISVITAKESTPETPIVSGLVIRTPRRSYRSGQPTRWLSKSLLVLILFLLPRFASVWAEEVIPLPITFSGYLNDQRSGKPIDGARIRVVSENGVDLTQGEWWSDSNGFYVVRTSRRVSRLASVEISRSDCTTLERLPLGKNFEVRQEKQTGHHRGPVFHHMVPCLSAPLSSAGH